MDAFERLAEDLLKLRWKAMENVEDNPVWGEVFHELSKHWFTLLRMIPQQRRMDELDIQEEEKP